MFALSVWAALTSTFGALWCMCRFLAKKGMQKALDQHMICIQVSSASSLDSLYFKRAACPVSCIEAHYCPIAGAFCTHCLCYDGYALALSCHYRQQSSSMRLIPPSPAFPALALSSSFNSRCPSSSCPTAVICHVQHPHTGASKNTIGSVVMCRQPGLRALTA